jgi:hypothetical protein
MLNGIIIKIDVMQVIMRLAAMVLLFLKMWEKKLSD